MWRKGLLKAKMFDIYTDKSEFDGGTALSCPIDGILNSLNLNLSNTRNFQSFSESESTHEY